ncbi:MAG TPA: LysR family transcriptional regulator [Streptosporangiaceae bacterium]|nr:LysR family transcriptional regulator [Streptosporangiaceae bacterium]
MKRAQAEPVRPPRADTHAPQGLDLRHLRYSAADADAGTFTRASEPLFIAQPALSQQVRRLELPDAARDGLSVVEHGVRQTRRRQAGVGRGSGLSTHHRSPVRVTAVTFGRRRRFW